MKDRQRRMRWLRLCGVLAALGLLGWTFRELEVGRVSEVIAHAGGSLFVWALLPMGLSLAVESYGWVWAFRRSGHDVPYGGVLRARVSSEALALTLPAGTLFCESTKPFLLARHCGLSMEASLAGMAVRKYLLLASQAIYIIGFVLLGAPFLERASAEVIGRPGLAVVLLGIGGVVFAVAIASGLCLRDGRVAERARGALACLPLPALRGKLEQSRGRFVDTDGELRRYFRGPLLGASSAPVLPFLASWVLESVETYAILRLLGVDLPFEAVAAVEVGLSFLRHVTFILPAGLGVQDLGYVAFLSALGARDPLTVGAAFVLIKRAKETLFALVGYGLLALDLRAESAAGPASLASVESG